jgi:hypothetical protein
MWPQSPGNVARVNFDWPAIYADKQLERKASDEFPFACDTTGHRLAKRCGGLDEQLLREEGGR